VPPIEDHRVDLAKVHERLQVTVIQVGQPGIRAEQTGIDGRPGQEHRPLGAVIGLGRPVLGHAAAELAEAKHQNPVRQLRVGHVCRWGKIAGSPWRLPPQRRPGCSFCVYSFWIGNHEEQRRVLFRRWTLSDADDNERALLFTHRSCLPQNPPIGEGELIENNVADINFKILAIIGAATLDSHPTDAKLDSGSRTTGLKQSSHVAIYALWPDGAGPGMRPAPYG